ncbi:hypothetical protein [Saccharopolyspora shandongensis]|uniref:hypothetical protein n=1 Tax=Saccharopolyspora shandongensis TaxID=418495 RepID=UPI003411C11F
MHDVIVEHLVDLDILATRLRPVVEEWRSQAEVGPLTWRDERAPWPRPIVPVRAAVEVPESLGIRLRRDPDDEIEVVVWTGGWADVGCVLDGGVTNLSPEFQDVDGAYAVVVNSVADFLA